MALAAPDGASQLNWEEDRQDFSTDQVLSLLDALPMHAQCSNDTLESPSMSGMGLA